MPRVWADHTVADGTPRPPRRDTHAALNAYPVLGVDEHVDSATADMLTVVAFRGGNRASYVASQMLYADDGWRVWDG